MSETDLKTYAGSFGPRSIILKDNQLFYRRDQGVIYPLVYMGNDRFLIEDLPYFRIHFIRDNGVIVALDGEYDDGRTDRSGKTIQP